MESSSEDDDREGSVGMEVEIVDRMEDPPREILRELVPLVEEDDEDVPILELASQVSHQHCIRSLGQISRQSAAVGTEHLQGDLPRRCCASGNSATTVQSGSSIRDIRETEEDSVSDGGVSRS